MEFRDVLFFTYFIDVGGNVFFIQTINIISGRLQVWPRRLQRYQPCLPQRRRLLEAMIHICLSAFYLFVPHFTCSLGWFCHNLIFSNNKTVVCTLVTSLFLVINDGTICWIFMVAIIPFGFGVVLFFTKKTHLTFRNQDFLQNPQISSESPRIPRIIIRTISNHHEVRPTFVPPVVDPRLLTTHRWLPAAGVGPSTNWRESGTSMIHNTCVYIMCLYVEYNIYILLKMIV